MHRSAVSIVRVGLPQGIDHVRTLLWQAITLAGGLEKVIPRGGLVLIKPNLVAMPPSREAGACTSAVVCQALADIVAELGGRPVIAESSSRGVDTEQVMEMMGYSALRQQGYEVVDLKKTETVRVAVPGGRVLDEVTTYKMALEAAAIISVPVMKTHDQTDVSLSLKNLKGLVTDAEKRRIHQLGVFEGVCDLAGLFRPTYAVVDGIMAQEGLGPVYGLPVQMGVLLAGPDLLAVDAVGSRVMGFDPREVRLLSTAEARGLGTLDEGEIMVVGDPISDVQRRFMRMEEDTRVQMQGVQILHAEGSCTGCRNGVLSSLYDMVQAGTIDRARGVIIVTGGALPPDGVAEERVIPVGICCSKELKGYPHYVKGCPPNNVDIVNAILAGEPV
jgi:uncharacterized protein (DUF362 family)